MTGVQTCALPISAHWRSYNGQVDSPATYDLNGWPWLPAQFYYLTARNFSATDQPFTLNLSGGIRPLLSVTGAVVAIAALATLGGQAQTRPDGRGAYVPSREKWETRTPEQVGMDAAKLADILVASEETEPGNGWDYHGFLSALVANPGASSFDLGSAAVG